VGSVTARGVLVTGGARGIGHAIVEAFIAAGDSVVSLDLAHPEPSSEPRLIQLDGSVTDRGALEAAVRTAVERAGSLDVAVCNAGVARYVPFLDLDDKTWQEHIDVDLTGAFRTGQVASRTMSDGAGGCIVMITSISAERPSRTQGHYCAAKAGVQMLAQAMAWELAEHRIRVNTVGPGWVETRLTSGYLANSTLRREVEATIPLGRVAQPSDIADAVMYLASPGASYITGAHLRVDGGLIIGKDKT